LASTLAIGLALPTVATTDRRAPPGHWYSSTRISPLLSCLCLLEGGPPRSEWRHRAAACAPAGDIDVPRGWPARRGRESLRHPGNEIRPADGLAKAARLPRD